ncbi:MAG: Gfo/Idh/MocA family oxidoreductase [Planctomycetota bacterium]|nr:Gfo/Idh/MocA family oxidoreductase [Planctomycetota bacterium]
MKAITRRRFLSQSAAGLAAAAATGVLQSRSAGGAPSANDAVVLALVGSGGRGTALAEGFNQLPSVCFKHVCDVETSRGQAMAKKLSKAGYGETQYVADIRRALDDKDVNGLIVATPEHWHALATVWACQAGKDVYVEKNVALTIWEGRKMIEAARKYKRVVQAGFQNRSAPYAATARDYIKSGKLGKVVHVKVYNMLSGGPWKAAADGNAPQGLDWDRWLGPAKSVPYNSSRHRDWYSWYEYCGGAYSGDASHQLDLARMVLGDPGTPKAAYCAGGNFAYGSQRPTPESQIVTYEYADFTMTCDHCTFPPYMRKSNGEERYGKKFPFWPQNNERIEIYGTKQMMYLGRHGVGWQVLEGEGKVVAEEKGYHPDKWHQPDFVESIRTRKMPNADIEQAHQSSNLVHMANISYLVGNQRLMMDPATERFTNSDAANALLKPAYREGYRVPDQV